jgi:type II secretory pathway component PulM
VKKYFAQLRPNERRLVVAVAVIFVLVLNAVFIWPHFSDWGKLRQRLADAHTKLKLYQTTAAQIPALTADVKKFASAGETVAPEDQGINFMRAIQSQSAQSGVQLQNISRQLTHDSDAFFVEQVVNINVLATEAQLVDFLYKLGSGASMIRVRDLELQPDAQHMHLNANIRLVASYQKNSPSSATVSTATAP